METTYATVKQINFLRVLAARTDHANIDAACHSYGIPARDLTIRQASDMIDWLQAKPTAAEIAPPPTVKPARVKMIGRSSAPATLGANIGGHAGMTATTKKGPSGQVVNDRGDQIDILFADGSFMTMVSNFVVFSA